MSGARPAAPAGTRRLAWFVRRHSEVSWPNVPLPEGAFAASLHLRFPVAWYPDSPPNVEKWKAPSCLACNNLHAANEGDLLSKFGMCIDPNDVASSGIVEKVLRGFNPAEGPNLRDSEIRAALRQKLLREAMHGSEITYEGIYPEFGLSAEIEAIPTDERMALRIPANALGQLTEKIIRGIIYLKDNRFLEPPYRIQHYVMTEDGAAPVLALLKKHGVSFSRAPAITVTRAVVPDDGITAIYRVEIWGRIRRYAFVTKSPNEDDT